MNKVNVLLVEDNPGDVRLIREALKDAEPSINITVAPDGLEAMRILNSTVKPPNLIILDLNLPRKSGQEVLKEVKADQKLKMIPIVILTTSSSREDINETYENRVNAFITKPIDLDKFIRVINSLQDFWLNNATLP